MCPHANLSFVSQPHCAATREDIKIRLEQDRMLDCIQQSPSRGVFEKTLALWTAFQNLGCPAPCKEATEYSGGEKIERDRVQDLRAEVQRGHDAKVTCEGRLLLEYDQHGIAFVR